MSEVSKWFDKHIPKGLDGYLTGLYQDIEREESPDKAAKLKMDFVKLVEQVLCQLPQHQDVAGQNIKIIVSEVGRDDEESRTSTPSDEVCDEQE